MAEKKNTTSITKRIIKKLWREPKVHLLIWTGMSLGGLAIILAFLTGVNLVTLHTWFNLLLASLGEHPVWIFLAIAILPAFPIPVSPLFILAGVTLGPTIGTPATVAIATAAMLTNTAGTYWLAATIGHGPVQRLFHWLEIKPPVFSRNDAYKITLLLKITPGVPFFLQNLILGFLRVPFRGVMLISCTIGTLSVVGFVVSAGAIFQGKTGAAIAGLSLLVAAALFTTYLRKRSEKSQEPSRTGQPNRTDLGNIA